MKRVLSFVIVLCVAISFTFCASASITHETAVADNGVTCYSLQPINSLYVNQFGTYYSAPSLNFTAFYNGFTGSSDRFTGNQRNQMQVVSSNAVENYGYYEQICLYPMSHNIYYSNGIYPYDSSRYTYFYSDISNLHRMVQPTYTGSCTFYFDSGASTLDAVSVDLTTLDVRCEALGMNFTPTYNSALHNYIDSEYPSNYVYRLYAPQYYAMQLLRDEGVPDSTINQCIGYSLNNCVETFDYRSQGVNYATFGTTFTTDRDYVYNYEVARKIMLFNINDTPLIPLEEDVWFDRITEALEEVVILDINLLQWFYLIFAVAVFGYVIRLLMGG